MRIDVWSDIVCPWCAIGKKRLEKALSVWEHGEQTRVVWHSFELDPTPKARRKPVGSLHELLASKYGMSPADALAANQRVTDVALAEGMQWNLSIAKPNCTLDAHRLLQLGASAGVQKPLMDAMMAAYFAEGKDISDPAVLTELGLAQGLSPTAIAALLAVDDWLAEVRDDEQQAAAHGITGVPFFVLGGRYGLSGAQPPETFARALAQAWADPAVQAAIP